LTTLKLIYGQAERGPIVSSVITAGALAALLAAELTAANLRILVPLLAIIVAFAAWYRVLVPWRSQVVLIVLVIFFIPIKRYDLPASLPFQLEPYRVVVGLVLLAWVSSLLIDPRVRLAKSEFSAQILLFIAVIGASLLANVGRVRTVSTDVVKTLLFFASFFVVYFLVTSVIRRRHDIDAIVTALAGGGTIIAVLAIIESRTQYNVFNHLSSVAPFLHYTSPFQIIPGRYGVLTETVSLARGGRLRVLGSAQHPIALGAALMMLIPFSIYLAQTTKRTRWWISAFVILLGSLATSSRTAITMLAAIVLVYVIMRAREVKRFWPALIPAVALIHFAIPGALGTTFHAFFPKGGLIAEQQDAAAGHARLATLGPALSDEVAIDPLFGIGFGTRIVAPSPSTPYPNAPILDDQWLGVLCETGIAGVFALGWLFVRFFRRMRRAARADVTGRGWLLVASAAAVASYGVGMFTFDSFGFIQVTFLFFIALGIGAVALRASPSEWATEPRATARSAVG
jgi:polysaccharide biosynthesis protein PslJ